jgi:hypothetical protein
MKIPASMHNRGINRAVTTVLHVYLDVKRPIGPKAAIIIWGTGWGGAIRLTAINLSIIKAISGFDGAVRED